MSNKIIGWIIGVQLVLAIIAIIALLIKARIVRRVHCWKAEHLLQSAAMVGAMTFWGMLFSSLFAFHSDNLFYSIMACILFTTFLVPFLGYSAYNDWPRESRPSQNHGKSALHALAFFFASVTLLSAGIWSACMNSSLSEFSFNIAVFCAAMVAFLLLYSAANIKQLLM